MPWSKRNSKTWDYSSGDLSGYIVLVEHRNGKIEYQGLVMNNKTKKVAPPVTAASLTACKNAVMRRGKALKK